MNHSPKEPRPKLVSTDHTPEPWSVTTDPCVPGRVLIEARRDGRKSLIAEMGHTLGHGGRPEDNAQRIVDCVNALRGIDDPARHLEELIKRPASVERELRLVLDGLVHLKRQIKSRRHGYKWKRDRAIGRSKRDWSVRFECWDLLMDGVLAMINAVAPRLGNDRDPDDLDFKPGQ